MSEKTTFNSVSQMMESLDGGSLTTELKKRISERKIVKALQSMRLAKDVPQAKIAEVLQCSQSRVSKIENGDDVALSLGEVEAYARALNCDVDIAFVRRGANAVDRVKRHANAMRRELEKLAECAHADESIASGVAHFFGEAFFNLVRIVELSVAKLPLRPDNGEPYVKITTTCEDIADSPEPTLVEETLRRETDSCPT